MGSGDEWHHRPSPPLRQRTWPCVTPYPSVIGQGLRARQLLSAEDNSPEKGQLCTIMSSPNSVWGKGVPASRVGPTVPTTPTFWPGLPASERPTPQRPGSPQRPQPPQKPLSHSVSFVKLNKVIFEERVRQAGQGVRLEGKWQARASRLTPSPGRVNPEKEATV